MNNDVRVVARCHDRGVLRAGGGALLVSLLLAGGCALQRPGQQAPVVDRGTTAAPEAAPVAAVPGAENAGKPGYFTVRPGDTLYRIGLDTGQNWRDIQAWNNLPNPNTISVGQVLRVAPPEPVVAASTGTPAATGAAVAPVAEGSVTARPLGSPGASAGSPLPAAQVAVAPVTAPSTAGGTQSAGSDELKFIWPVSGNLIDTFDDAKNKGVGIAGKMGDPVVAAADGRVVYAGAGLRGYGNLIILKHNNTYLTAYAHNQSLLVREDQAVRQGQKIAEMGSSDTDRVKLHFEVRRQGKPVDPLKHLPAR